MGRVINGERGNREGGMEGKEEKREAHFYQSAIFDSAERVTLVRKTKAASLSLSLSLCLSYHSSLPPPSLILLLLTALVSSQNKRKMHSDTFI